MHLEQLWGEPTFCYPEHERGLPSILWERPRLTIGYSLLGVRPRLKIAHEPDGYDELKLEARIIREREGEGARVEYGDFHWQLRRGLPKSDVATGDRDEHFLPTTCDLQPVSSALYPLPCSLCPVSSAL